MTQFRQKYLYFGFFKILIKSLSSLQVFWERHNKAITAKNAKAYKVIKLNESLHFFREICVKHESSKMEFLSLKIYNISFHSFRASFWCIFSQFEGFQKIMNIHSTTHDTPCEFKNFKPWPFLRTQTYSYIRTT